ncbi:hypothetical protein COUCH_06750 [Couchioplanes caeruleus]|uniref:RHS repeat-associated core domain-containing protein n=1 Tax=Couchioplanes caeruleus TaxID=56438 RepID=UPI0020C17DCD|nr:RHS repeat-associated core domain-containing protein [Couchioplanes caeruleus]UQU65996.1 hypothetical protein COUCH_06750 [Couchioplanes caeruleus]
MVGESPEITLSYSSSSVDGRSSATNNQPSWIGEGFEYSPGFIERQYIPCAEDKSGTQNAPAQTGDLCWRTDNATLNLNGSSTELIYQSGKGWRPRLEDGSKIEKLTGGTSDDKNGEHWRVTATDGTQYYFGLNKLPGQTAETKSVWAVPVYGNHANEPGHADKFADSDEMQAWRWNLDYTVDVRGNTVSHWYDAETNYYAPEVSDTKKAKYTRGGALARTDYGTWDRAGSRSTTPLAQVVYTPGDRCLSDCTKHDGAHWPDTPWDQECTSAAANCKGKYSPTFWSVKRLAVVTTKVWDTTKTTPAWQDVDSWTLTHSFPSPGDGQLGGLWLKSIVHAGLVGTRLEMPPVELFPTAMRNRVLTKTNTTNNWQRLDYIKTETGSLIDVRYSEPGCKSDSLPSSPHTNTRMCYPVIGPDPAKPGSDLTEWWLKYRVEQVTESDVQLASGHQSPTKNTYYTYIGDPAWHYADDDGLTKPKRKTWSQFRGYEEVEVRVGDTQQTLTRTKYLRGMHGDKLAPTGGTRDVTVTADYGTETVKDEDAFAGMVRQQSVYNGTIAKPVSRTVNVPWQSPPTATRTINGDAVSARYVESTVTYESTALGEDGKGGWRTTRVETKFDDATGDAKWTSDEGDVSKANDEKCVTYTPIANPAKNITGLSSRITTTALTCGEAAKSSDDVISDVRQYFDGATPAKPKDAPEFGSVTMTQSMADWTVGGGTVWQTDSEATFDTDGRQLTTTNNRKQVSETTYAPASGFATTRTVTDFQDWATVTKVNPYWGSTTQEKDVNGRVVDTDYDALGRVVRVWEPGWSKAAHPNTPSARFTYSYSPTRSTYPYTKSEALKPNGVYETTYDIYDGFLNPRQTQVPAVGEGRVVSDTIYDEAGRVASSYPEHAEPGTASGTLWWEPEWSVPTMTRNVYDRAGRSTNVIFLAGDGVTNLVEKWRTTTAYLGDRTRTTPPPGGVASTVVTDAQGRTTETHDHKTAAGVAGAAVVTRRSYGKKGALAKVTDSAGNEWVYKYDVKGRLTQATDPDKGTTHTSYDEYDQPIKTTDARGEILITEWDPRGRKIGLYDDRIAQDTKRAEWYYDKFELTRKSLRGALTRSTRFEGGNAYTTRYLQINDRYQPTGVSYEIPDAETGLGGTWTFGYGFADADGSPTTVDYPAGGGLTSESVEMVYDDDSGMPRALNTNLPNVGSYVVGQVYNAYGDPTVTTRKTAGGVYAEEALRYDEATRRLAGMKVKAETASGSAYDTGYEYDAAGNVVEMTDRPEIGAADKQCFEYDALRRLTSAWTPHVDQSCKAPKDPALLNGPAPYWTDWSFDDLGNRTTETGHSMAGKTVKTYAVPPSGAGKVRPHAVDGVSTAAPGETTPATQSFHYNDAGDMESRPGPTGVEQVITYDSEDRPVRVTEADASYTNVYDAEGDRLLRRDPKGTTLYLPGMEIRREVGGGSSSTEATRYYSFGGATVAVRKPGARSLEWVFEDTQGTQRITINAETQQTAVRRQTPYGKPRGTDTGQWATLKGFVGGDRDPTGLTRIGARDYDPELGRFITVDPLLDLDGSQQMNAYSYAVNNPVTFADPSGLMIDAGGGMGRSYGGGWFSFALHLAAALTPIFKKPLRRMGGDRGSRVRDAVSAGTRGMWRGVKDYPKNTWHSIKQTITHPIETIKSTTAQAGYWHQKYIFVSTANPQVVGACMMTGLCQVYEDLKAGNYEEAGYGYANFALDAVLAAAGAAASAGVSAALKGVKGAAGAARVKPRAHPKDRAGAPKPNEGGAAKPNEGGDSETGGTNPSCDSFAAETLVLMADGSTRPISSIHPGDMVLATDPETGETVSREIINIHVNEDSALADVSVEGADGHREVLHTTQNHLFWDEGDGVWRPAVELSEGAAMRSNDGRQVYVRDVNAFPGLRVMHNLSVDGIPTYYVLAGSTPVLVHNDGNYPTSGTIVSRGTMKVQIYANDHGPPHAHLKDGRSDIQIGQNGKPLDRDVTLNSRQQAFVDENIKTIRGSIKAKMRECRLSGGGC